MDGVGSCQTWRTRCNSRSAQSRKRPTNKPSREAARRTTMKETAKVLVALGGAGITLGVEVPGLARNSGDWYQLLDLCSVSGTVIGEEESPQGELAAISAVAGFLGVNRSTVQHWLGEGFIPGAGHCGRVVESANHRRAAGTVSRRLSRRICSHRRRYPNSQGDTSYGVGSCQSWPTRRDSRSAQSRKGPTNKPPRPPDGTVRPVPYSKVIVG